VLYDLTHRRYWSRNLAGCMGWLSLVKDILYSTSRYPIFVRFLRSRLRIAVRQPASYFQILALKEALATRESMLHVRRQTTIFTTSSMTPTQWHIYPHPSLNFTSITATLEDCMLRYHSSLRPTQRPTHYMRNLD